MSNSTGVRKRRTPEDRIDEAIDGVADAYLRKARRYSDKALSQGGALGTGPIYGSINPGTNSLQTSGGAMIGSIAFNPALIAVDDGRINIEPDQNEASKDSSYVLVTGQGSPDDLFFIDGADKNGQYLILQGTLTQILVLKAATISGISNISGVGTVTVVTTSDHNMLTGAKANIIGPTNFSASNVTVTVIDSTSFTYSAIGSVIPETAGFVQNGNIVTPDGNDVILDGTQSLNGVPLATLIFDPTVAGFGAWRLVSVSVVSGTAGDFLRVSGGVMFGSIAYDPDFVFVDSNGRVPITSSYIQSSAPVAPNNEVFFFDGALFNGQQLVYQVTNQTIQVIKNGVFKNISNIVGNGTDNTITVTIDDTSLLNSGDTVNINGTTTFDINDAEITITGATTFTYDLGSVGSATPGTSGTVQRGNIVMPDDQDLTLDSNISTLGAAIATFVFDPTIGGGSWRLTSSTVGGGGGDISFPIRPPVTTGLPTTGNVILDLDQTSGHYFTIGPLTGNIDISITNPPAANTAQAFRINIIKGATDFTVTFNDTLLVQPFIGEENTTTLLAGDIYDGAVFNIFTMTSTAGSGTPTEFWSNFPAVSDVDFATFDGINMDRLLFDQTAGEVLTADVVGITSDVSGNFLTNAVGEYQWLVDANLVMALNASQLTMSANIDMSNKSLFDAITVDFNISNTFDPTTLTIIGFDSFSLGLKYNSGATTTNHQFEIGGEPMVLISRLGASRGALTTERVILDELIDLTSFTNSSPTNGHIWLDLTSGLFKFRQNGVTVELGGGGGTPSSIIDGNTSFTADGGGDTLTGTFDGNSNRQLIFGQGTARYEMQTANYTSTYIRNDATSGGVDGNFIHLEQHKGFDNDATPLGIDYYQTFSEIAEADVGLTSGKFTVNVAAKGSLPTAYILEGGAGLINTNILHSFFGSMILKSDQTDEQAIFRMERNDSSTMDDDTIGSIQFRAENSINVDTIFGSMGMEIPDNYNTSEDGRFFVNLQNGATNLRVIEADMLTNTIRFIPVTNFEYDFSNAGFEVRRITASAIQNAEISLLKEDTGSSAGDNIGEINFTVFDDPTTTEYARILSTIKNQNDAGSIQFDVRADGVSDVNALTIEGSATTTNRTFVSLNAESRIGSDLKFQAPTGSTDLKIFPALNQLGIVVQDNVSFTVGSLGTNAIPATIIINGEITSDTQADGLFGDHEGAMGIVKNSVITNAKLWVKIDGGWQFVEMTDAF